MSAESRFFIDHGVIHDRETGRHLTADYERDYPQELLNVLQFLERRTSELSGVVTIGKMAVEKIKSDNDRLLARQVSVQNDIDHLAQALIDSESVITLGAQVIKELLDENGADIGIDLRIEKFKESMLNLGRWRTRDAFVNSAPARLDELLAWRASVMAEAGSFDTDKDVFTDHTELGPVILWADYYYDMADHYKQSALNLAAKLTEIATTIHYTQCWDTAAYPTLSSAISEMAHCATCEATQSQSQK